MVRNENGEIDTEKTDEAVYAISASLFRRRLISYGGVFRKAHKELHLDEIEGGDLVHTEIEANVALSGFITFNCVWKGKVGYVVSENSYGKIL
jgi:plasmid rolling circle replication initiator protein Rep